MADGGTEVTMITDPLPDLESQRVVRSVAGCQRLEWSPNLDGVPIGSRSVFVFDQADLIAGRLEACIDLLGGYGIVVHREVGDHPAVRRTNRKLGYL